MTELPRGWTRASIADVTLPYETLNPGQYPASNFAYIDIGSIDNRTQTVASPKHFPGRHAPSRARRIVAAGDVLFSTVRTYLKNIAIVPHALDGELASTGIALLRTGDAIESRYLFHFVRSDAFVTVISKAQDGTLYPAVSEKEVKSGTVPLAPIAEQKRIVAKIDTLTARTAQARADLAGIPALVAKYKSAVLDSAFSGRLTADLRGDEPRGPHDLPAGWLCRPLGDISHIQGGIQIGKKRDDHEDVVEVPYLRVANVQRGRLNLDEIKTVLISKSEKDRLLLRKGDILMNEGGDRDKLGRGWIWNDQIPQCVHQNHVFRIRLRDGILPPEFVSHFANDRGQRYFFEQGTQTTNLASVSKSKVAALPVPVPPLDEAVEIVQRIGAAFAWLDSLSAGHDRASALLPKLDETILAKAFRGELVAQDPDDEPADVLLERVRNAQGVEVRRGRRRRPNQARSMKEPRRLAKSVERVLADAGDWLRAQTLFDRCGITDGASTDDVERVYAELRDLDVTGKLEVEAVADGAGRKTHDRIRLKER